MEESKLEPERNDRIAVFRQRRRPTRFQTIILVALIAVGLVVSVFVWPQVLDTNVQILKAGDHLHYDLITHFNGTTYNGSADYNIHGADKSGISYMSFGSSWGTIEDFGHDFKPYLAGPDYYGELVGARHLNTSFGTKCVKEMYRFDLDEVVVLSMGMDSSLVYRWTVSSSDGDYWYSYELTESNNTRLASVDQVMRTTSVKGLSSPTATRGPSLTCQWHEPSGGHAGMSGSVEVEKGESFHYIVGGNMTVLVFDLQDLRDIQDTGEFTYQSALSRPNGDPGETNITAEPGTYWYHTDYTGSSAPIPASEVPAYLYASDINVGAYFVSYFDS